MAAIARFCVVTLAALAFALAASYAALSFPALSGRVVDDADILSSSTRDTLTRLLAEHEKQTGNQVVVVTLKSLQGSTIEQYGYQLGRAWGIGIKGKNNGALLIVSPNTHDVRIEVGYGLEGLLTDAQSKLIIENVMLPSFRKGDSDGGVLNGTITTLKALGGNPSASVAPTPAVDEQPDNAGGGIRGVLRDVRLDAAAPTSRSRLDPSRPRAQFRPSRVRRPHSNDASRRPASLRVSRRALRRTSGRPRLACEGRSAGLGPHRERADIACAKRTTCQKPARCHTRLQRCHSGIGAKVGLTLRYAALRAAVTWSANLPVSSAR